MSENKEKKSRWNHTHDDTNMDINETYTMEWYEKAMDFESSFPDPVIKEFIQPDGRKLYVADESEFDGGLKCRAAELVVKNCPTDVMVYGATMRTGHAPQAIAILAKKFDKKVVFFTPSSKRMSVDQIKPKKYLGDNCTHKFYRIAASPVLCSYAKKFCEETGATYIPFGFSGVKEVAAGIARASRLYAKGVKEIYGSDPTQVWCVYSTGTMGRALQIGMGHIPGIEFHGSAVARNMKPGEVGKAKLWPEERAFNTPVKDPDEKAPFPCVATYDEKLWKTFVENAKDGAVFINVSRDATKDEEVEYNAMIDEMYPDTVREWGDMQDDTKQMDWDK